METKEQGKSERFDLLDRYPRSIYGGDMWVEYKFCCLRCGFVFAVETRNAASAMSFMKTSRWYKRADSKWICGTCVKELQEEAKES